MISFKRTNSSNPDFITLVNELDADLASRDGAEHSFYAQYNKLDNIKHVILAYDAEAPVACGAIKEFAPGIMEVKRMYTLPLQRGRGVAAKVLAQLEQWAAEMSYQKCILETGYKQPEAIRLYTKCGYSVIENYGQYAGVQNSICFEKLLQ